MSLGGRDEYGVTLKAIMQPTLAVGIRSDVLYLLEELEDLCRYIPHSELAVMEGPHGHDTFLIDQDELNEMVLTWRQRHIDPLIDSVQCRLSDGLRPIQLSVSSPSRASFPLLSGNKFLSSCYKLGTIGGSARSMPVRYSVIYSKLHEHAPGRNCWRDGVQ